MLRSGPPSARPWPHPVILIGSETTLHHTRAPRSSAAVGAVLLTRLHRHTPHHGMQDPAAVTSAKDCPYRDTELEHPFPQPDPVSTDTSGKPLDPREQTKGKTTPVFFGYTNCLDVCPSTMGDISVAPGKQPAEVRDGVEAAFGTTDPERDTPESLGKWLGAFGENFTGLSGDLEKGKKAALGLGISVEDPTKHHDDTITSDHGAQVAAFSPADDKAHVIYTSGTTVEDFAHDLPLPAKNTR